MIFWVFHSCLDSVVFLSEKIALQERKSWNWWHTIDIFNVYLKTIISETSRFSNEWLWILSCIFLTLTCIIDLYMVSLFNKSSLVSFVSFKRKQIFQHFLLKFQINIINSPEYLTLDALGKIYIIFSSYRKKCSPN